MAKEKTKKKIEKEIIAQMKSLETYRPEYDKIIGVYASMLYQYQKFEKEFEDSDYKITEEYTNKAGATNERKTPLYTALESLRKDIAIYSDRLCLNPQSRKAIKAPSQGKSKLIKALSDIR